MPAPRDRPLPASSRQEWEWLYERELQEKPHQEPIVVVLTGTLNLPALMAAVAGLRVRRENLRTRFPLINGTLMQVIEPPTFRWPLLVDFSGLPEERRDRAAEQVCAAGVAAEFGMQDSPPITFAVLRLAPDRHTVVITPSYTLIDLWSFSVLADELSELYRAFAAGGAPELDWPHLHHADLALWQRQWWDRPRREAEIQRWRQRLDGVRPPVLPGVYPRPADLFRNCVWTEGELDEQASRRLRDFSRAENVTLYVLMLAVLHCVLARCCTASTVITTSAASGRRARVTETMTGCLMDYLVVVGDLRGNPTFREVLARTSDAVLAADDHQRLPLPEVVAGLDPGREQWVHPLERTMFNLHNLPASDLDLRSGISGRLVDDVLGEDHIKVNTDLAFDAFDYGTGCIILSVFLDIRRFDPADGPLWEQRYQRVLDQVLTDPDLRLDELDLLSERERDLVLSTATERTEPDSAVTVVQMLRHRAAATPDAVAVVDDDHQLSWRGLYTAAADLAARVRATEPGLEQPVVLALRGGIDLAVATWAVLLAGGVPVVLDTATPPAALVDSVVLHRRSDQAPPEGSTRSIDLDAGAVPFPPAPVASPAPDSLAVVAGSPAGLVALSHRAVAGTAAVLAGLLGLGPGSVVAGSGRRTDAPRELFLSAANGACLHWTAEGRALPGWVQRRRPGLVLTAAGSVEQLLEAELDGVTVAVGGGPLTTEMIERLRGSGGRLFGVTDLAPVGVAAFADLTEPAGFDRGVGPLGRPPSGRPAVVMDDGHRPAPVGVPGELWSTGTGLARGFLADPAATAARFVPDPAGHGQRCYRTGLRVRRAARGGLEIAEGVGHVDHNGYLVPTERVEQVLGRYPGVTAVLVTTGHWREGTGMYSTALFCALASVDRPGPMEYALREFARPLLPPQCVPTVFVELPADRIAAAVAARDRGLDPLVLLPALDRSRRLPDGGAPPAGELERCLTALADEILPTAIPHRRANFFRGGGTLTDAVHLLTLVEQRWGTRIPLPLFIADPTIANLATRIDA